MPPPLESVNVINRSPSMPNIGPGEPLEPIGNQNNPVQGNAPQNPPPVVPPAQDPVVNQVVENGVGPNLHPDNGQAAQFAANHEVEVGHDWDMKSAEGMLDTAQKAVRYIKDKVAASRSFDDYGRALTELSAQVIGNDPENPSADIKELKQSLDEFKQLFKAGPGLMARLPSIIRGSEYFNMLEFVKGTEHGLQENVLAGIENQNEMLGVIDIQMRVCETIETLVSIASDEDVVHEDLNCKLIPTFENIQERYMMATLSNGVEFNLS